MPENNQAVKLLQIAPSLLTKVDEYYFVQVFSQEWTSQTATAYAGLKLKPLAASASTSRSQSNVTILCT